MHRTLGLELILFQCTRASPDIDATAARCVTAATNVHPFQLTCSMGKQLAMNAVHHGKTIITLACLLDHSDVLIASNNSRVGTVPVDLEALFRCLLMIMDL